MNIYVILKQLISMICLHTFRREEPKPATINNNSDGLCQLGFALPQDEAKHHSNVNVEEEQSSQQKMLTQMVNYLRSHYYFRYNQLTDRTECAAITANETAVRQPQTFQPVDNRLLNSISLRVMQAGIPCWDRDIKRFVESDNIHPYHPFSHYFEQLPAWDGKDRITALARRVSHNELWVKSFHRWMLATTSQWMFSGNHKRRANSVAPLLISLRQGFGKSTFCRMLLPETLRQYFTESFDLTNHSSAENKLASFGLINLDEFDRLPARRMPQLKNLMQMECLNIRRAYKHSGEPLPRIASFIGTSNQRELLTDSSGSRRFICVEVERPIDCATPLEHDQLYAQLKHELLQGERSWFSKQEEREIEASNEQFYRVIPVEDLFGGLFAMAGPNDDGAKLLSSAQIYETLKSKSPAVLKGCSLLAFSKLLAQIGKRVHTNRGNGYWVKSVG